MKNHFFKFSVCLGLALFGASLSLPAIAQHGGFGGRGGGYYGGGHGGGYYGGWRGGGWYGGPGWWGWGWGLGLGLGWGAAAYWGYPYYGYPYYGYPYATYAYPDPGYSYPSNAPPVAAPQSPAPASNWYYCDSAKGYYPYVRQCPEPWRTVPAVPPGVAQ